MICPVGNPRGCSTSKASMSISRVSFLLNRKTVFTSHEFKSPLSQNVHVLYKSSPNVGPLCALIELHGRLRFCISLRFFRTEPCGTRRAANHYDFCRIITIFCLSLRHYAHTLKYYDKSSIFPGPYPPFYHPHECRNHASWTHPASGACAQFKVYCTHQAKPRFRLDFVHVQTS